MKVAAIIQARMGSTRLPGKVMKPLCGIPVLGHVIKRARAIQGIDAIVVATTQDRADDVVDKIAMSYGVTTFRGSTQDVLDRYYGAALNIQADVVVRITSDCPLLDPALVSAMLEMFHAERRKVPPADYLSNTLTRSYPRGLDAELFTFSALARAWREASLPAEREHVTPYLYRHPEIFRLVEYVGRSDLSRYRLTLDTEDDWRVLEAVCTGLSCASRLVAAEEVIAFLDQHPAVARLNAHVEQKATEA
jgi:spore coat polysaccharide biosynthesis protein SpsF